MSVSSSIPKLKLIYFEDRGKTDLIKLILSLANQPYEDIQIKPTEWSQYKPYMPFEQVPVLVVNDTNMIAQPMIICRYLAQLFRLNGSSDLESIMCDMVVEQLREVIDYSVQIVQEYDLAKRSILVNNFMNNLLPKTLNGYEKMLSLNRNKFIVGNQLTWADLALVNGWEWLDEICGSVLRQYQLVKAHNEFVRSVKAVSDWFKSQKPLRVAKNV